VLVCALVGCFGVSSGVAAAQSYTVTELGTLGTGYSEAIAVDESGRVLGWYGGGSGSFLYDESGMRDISAVVGRPMVAYHMNDHGEIAGTGTVGNEQHALVWDGTQVRDLGLLPGGTWSEAWDISNTGIAVGRGDTTGGQTHAFIWDGGALKDLGTLSGGKTSEAFSINTKGQVVGDADTADGFTHAFLYDGSGMHDLGALPGGRWSSAFDVNEAGQSVGYSEKAAGDFFDYPAALWKPDGSAYDLGALPFRGSESAFASAINCNGVAVGYAFADDGQPHMVVFRDGGIVDVSELIGYTPPNLYTGARDINDKGLIAGSRWNTATNATNAVLLTPTQAEAPCPATGSLALELSTTEADVGQMQTATATFSGAPVPAGAVIEFQVSGANSETFVAPLDSSGKAIFAFIGHNEGTDTISATMRVDGGPVSSNKPTITWRVPPLPPVTRSFYEGYVGKPYFLTDGRFTGESGKDGVVVLSLGAPRAKGQILFGSTGKGGGLRSYDQILQSMEAFSNAYHNGWQSVHDGSVLIVWGTNNVLPRSWKTNLAAARDAGIAFGRAVRKFQVWVAGPHGKGIRYNRQSVAAGFDIEVDPRGGWSDYPETRAFLQGYESVAHPRMLNYGSFDVSASCTSTSCATFGRFKTQWTAPHFLDVARPPLVDLNCPQVYSTDKIDNWTGLEERTTTKVYGLPHMYFKCLFNSDPAPPFLTPQKSWTAWWKALAARFRTEWFEKKVTKTHTLSSDLSDPPSVP
jgi:probable HAF family extracellular repeat protein